MERKALKQSLTPADDTAFMRRCFDLARLGLGRVSPNPAVGAVLAYRGRIIGEGYHARYGGPHAEVNAVASVSPADRPLIPQSTLYVSLEPCSIYGRTPPCTGLVLEQRIGRVVIAQRDHTPGVDGNGVRILREAGVEVTEHVLSEEGLLLSLPRQLFATRQRPYVFLKYAQSADGFLAPATADRYWITHPLSRRLVHRWRTQTAAILVGGRTARADNPELSSRYFPGPQPLRVVVNRSGELPAALHLLDGRQPTLVLGPPGMPAPEVDQLEVVEVHFDDQWPLRVLQHLHERRINHLTVEGGAAVLTAFIERNLWDEAAVFTGKDTYFQSGLEAPRLPVPPRGRYSLLSDELAHYLHPASLALFAGS